MKTLNPLFAVAMTAVLACAQALAQVDTPETPVLVTGDPVGQTLIAAPEALPEDIFARDTFRIDTFICPFKGDMEYDPGDIECGLLQVPENREDPDSRFIELHFVKLNSRWGKDEEEADDDDEGSGLPPGKRDDPIIYLTGGPGAKVTYYVNRFKDHTILDHRDMYILEQRGIGFSDDFCPFYGNRNPAVQDVETFEESLLAGEQTSRDCATNATAAGVDLTGYNTIENARDVKALRIALGYDQWNVWGISYGSILGQAYIKEDPEGILAVALDAIMPLEIRESELYWRVVHWYERDLQKLQEICQRQPDCASRYPDIPGRIREAVTGIAENPIVVDVKDTEVFPSGQARFFQNVAAMLPFIFLYEQDNYPALPGLIYAWAEALEQGEGPIFETIAAAASSGGFGDSSAGMQFAILCMDGDVEAQTRASLKDLEEYPILGAALGTRESIERAQDLCNELGMPQRAAEEYSAVQTDIPSLIIEGDMDPITPPANAKAILPGFSNGTYVEFPYAGHGPTRSVECAGHMLNAFYDNPTDEPDLSCVEEMEEPEMWAPMYTTSVVPRLAALALDDKKKVAGPAMWIGLSSLVLIFAFFNLTFAPLGRMVDGRTASDTGGSRGLAWAASTLGLISLGIIGGAFAATSDVNQMLLLFGLAPWASFGAWAGLLAGIAGLATLVATIRAHRDSPLAFGSLLGLSLIGLAAMAYGAFLWVFDLRPF